MARVRKQLSPGEWQILLALWRLDKRATVDEVIRELGEQPPPSKGKIRTLLHRAIQKGFVRTALVKRPSGRSPTLWLADCPGRGHRLHVSTASDQFGCGYCRRKGGPAELEALVAERGKEKNTQ